MKGAQKNFIEFINCATFTPNLNSSQSSSLWDVEFPLKVCGATPIVYFLSWAAYWVVYNCDVLIYIYSKYISLRKSVINFSIRILKIINIFWNRNKTQFVVFEMISIYFNSIAQNLRNWITLNPISLWGHIDSNIHI